MAFLIHRFTEGSLIGRVVYVDADEKPDWGTHEAQYTDPLQNKTRSIPSDATWVQADAAPASGIAATLVERPKSPTGANVEVIPAKMS
jgi:hypothetical protein